jgi:hypothetical protein
MLHFLTDEHISPAVAEQARRKHPGTKIIALHDWRDGQFLGASDAVFIPEAAKENLTFVSYDLRTTRPLLKLWAELGIHHTGIVFIDEKTIAPQDFGGLVRALGLLWQGEKNADWNDRVVFLQSKQE